MIEFISRIFGRTQGAAPGSKDTAKQRLKFLLIHDQVDLSPAQLEQMKAELIKVIAKYVEIDESDTAVRLERSDGQIALVSSIPVRRVVEREVASLPKEVANNTKIVEPVVVVEEVAHSA
jgi:cell division topological specificity factor